MELIQGHSSSKTYTATADDYEELLELWEASVRETHDFLTEENIQAIKGELKDFLPSCVVVFMRDDDGAISGFVGVAGERIEMLFVHPTYMGRSIGKRLFMHAVVEMKAKKLDVNERNDAAVGFYLRQGCRVTGRSAVDSVGRPFPVLHMECNFSG